MAGQYLSVSVAANEGDAEIQINAVTPNYAYPVGSVFVPNFPWIPTPSTYSAQVWPPSGYTFLSATTC